MAKLTLDDITDLRAYERERDEFRTEIISMKKRRRIPVGDILTMVFENTATMRFQIQEMARVERMLRDEQIAHEIETYNELIPEDGELSCTLFIELTDDEALRYWLPRLTDIERNIVFVVGDEVVEAREQDAYRLTRDDITSTVHYLKFGPFTEAQQAAFRDGGAPVRIVVEHPEYQADVALTADQREELVGDFAA